MATIHPNIEIQDVGFFRRSIAAFTEWAGNEYAIRILEIVSVIILIAMAVFTFLLLTSKGAQSEPLSPAMAASLLVANLLPATTILVLIGRRIALRRGELINVGNRQRLHVRLVAIFSLLSAIPTLLLVIFASLLFQSGVEFWFSGSARGMLENAGELAKGYYQENQAAIRDETDKMSSDLRRTLSQTNIDDPEFFSWYLNQMYNRKLSESAIVSIRNDGTQKSDFVMSGDDKRNDYQWLDDNYLARIAKGERIVVAVKPNKIEAVTVLFDNPKTYLYTNRAESLPTFSLASKAQSVLRDYQVMEKRSRSLQLQFNSALYIVSLLIVAITVWVALIVADRLVRPITGLVKAAQIIADGDLSARVSIDPTRTDEVEFLSQSFNVMTDKLQSQTSTLLATNRQLDDRRAFIETVLESVSAGIVSLDKDGFVRLANSTAELLLKGKSDTIVGQKFNAIAPVLAELIESDQQQGVVQLGDGSEPLTVAVKVITGDVNSVITFEDISQQLADQRRAAWSDVARRIAHEIKNPLTPIQLAAERLQRRFGKQAGDDEAIFKQLTGTIVRQVGDLRNIVDEFSAFARMPKPIFRSENLTDIVGHAIFLFEVGHPDIRFSFAHPQNIVTLICDRRQLGQAITNIVKNAVEAISESDFSDQDKGLITVKIEQDETSIIVSIADNGPGLPEQRERLLEPYVTTRTKGSGLGLAIVRKIIEEHFGEITFGDAKGVGALIQLRFSPDTIASRIKTASQSSQKDLG
jgi:two-component system, NtrC family, nitrogen regulation sensor histidine kinase NtrY